MANILSPFGFRHVGYLGGFAPTFEPDVRFIAKANATAIYQGDPVTTLSTGYITQSTAGTTQIAGIFQSVTYQSTAAGSQFKRSLYWPGSDGAADPIAQIISSPQAVFMAQANAQATLAHVGQNVNFALGTGSTATGISGATVDISTVGTTTTLPFRIIGLASTTVGAPFIRSVAPGSNGSDGTTAYNYVYVTFNFQDFKSTTGI